jgi:hypothetical protein
MEHWSPDKAEKADAPGDAWAAWLSRPPELPAPPQPLPPPSVSGIAVVLSVAGFWMGAIALGWQMLG